MCCTNIDNHNMNTDKILQLVRDAGFDQDVANNSIIISLANLIHSAVYEDLLMSCNSAIEQNQNTYDICVKNKETFLAAISAGALEQSRRFYNYIRQNLKPVE